MGRPESYAGITVPEGSPDELRTLAGSFSSASAEMLSTATTLGGLPSELGVWQGPASVNFASSSLTA